MGIGHEEKYYSIQSGSLTKGGILRELLNDPTLPDDPVANPEALDQLKKMNLPQAVPIPPTGTTQKLPYGSNAPEIAPSKVSGG